MVASLESVAGHAKALLERALTLERFDLKERDRLAQAFHDAGHYAAALLVKEDIRRWYMQQKDVDPEEVAVTIEYMLASAAGLALPAGTRSAMIPHPLRNERPLLFSQLANIAANSQSWDRAKDYLIHAETLLAAKRRAYNSQYGAIRVRRAQVLRDQSAAQEALRELIPHTYTHHTALITAGWISFERSELTRAQKHFEQILQEPRASWLYRAEAWCGLGCIKIRERRDTKGAFQLLTKAQFVVAMLGQLPVAHTDIVLESTPVPWSGYPGEVLRSYGPFARYDRRKCTALRRQAVAESGLQNRLFLFLGDPP